MQNSRALFSLVPKSMKQTKEEKKEIPICKDMG